MGLLQPAVVLLLLLIALCIAGHAVNKHNGRVIGKREARIALNELRKKHISHVLKRSADSEIDEEEVDIDLSMIERELERFEDTLRSTEETGTDQHEAKGGEKLIQEALKGNVDPDSAVVNLLESMYVDEGSRHNQHPEGIENIASKKGKVFGDTHDSHRLTQHQIEELNQNGGRKKNFLKSATLWTDNIIPYTIHSSFSSDQSNVDVLNEAIQQFTDYTCLKWVPYGSDEANKASYPNYIEFISGSGCWSYVGRVFDDKQQISLEDPGCVSVSTAVHEMAHAIGQEHEQSRNDRDNYVTMLWSNIQGGKSNNNMEKTDTYDYNPYDYESVLQYSLKSFSSNGQPTIEFKDRRLEFLADSATGLMFYDIQDITDGYNCTARCRGADGNTPLKQCQNGGFVLHTCNCHCPDGLTGDLCESVATDPECGTGIIDLADGESRTITSPNFNNGGPYPTGKECVWLVKVMPGNFVEMTIEELDLTTENSACDHWLEIRYNLIGQTGPRRCGKVIKETYVTALHGNPTLMLLKFDSAFASTATAGKGFNLTVSSVGGAGITTSPATQNPSTLYPVTSFQTTLYPVTSFQTTSYPVTSLPTTPYPVTSLPSTLYPVTSLPSTLYPVTSLPLTLYPETSFSTQFPTTQTPSPPVVDQDLHCTFETGTPCFLNNVNRDSFDWQTGQGSAPSGGTGPTSAYEGHQYSYIDPSAQRGFGVAILHGPTVRTTQLFCLTFAYQLHGTAICSLVVEMKFSDGQRDLFYTYDDSGNSWIVKQITVPPSNGEIRFIGILRESTRGNIAIDDIHFVSGSCYSEPIALPLSCTFEVGTECFLKDAVGSDDFDWTISSNSTQTLDICRYLKVGLKPSYFIGSKSQFGANQNGVLIHIRNDLNKCACAHVDPRKYYKYVVFGNDRKSPCGETPSYDTGPSNAAEGSRYAYIESTGKDPHSKASLERIVQIPKDGNMCLSFNYHMYGQTVESLEVLFQDLTFFREVGNKGDQWNKAEVTLFNVSSTVVPKIQFTATLGSGYRGDIAIDNIQLSEGECAIARCTFEVGTECFLKDVVVTDDFDWTILSGETPSLETGPAKAFEGSRYAYIESTGIEPYSRASFEGIVQIPKDGDLCLSFNYHMYGETIDSLEVLFQNITYFHKVGNKGNQWNKAKFTLSDRNSAVFSKIQFIATRGSGYKGDIAIDNIQLSEGECVKDCRSNPCDTNTICVQETSTSYRCDCRPGFTGHFCDIVIDQANCTFEKGEDCFLKNSTLDDFDWSLNSGRTPSSKTGPGSAKQGSWYAYIETTNRLLGQKAMLVPKYRFKNEERCLTFAYHMYGETGGSLRVLQEKNRNSTEIFSKSGEQSNSSTNWEIASLSINHYVHDRIVFEATRGTSFTGGIALDDIKYFPGRCACDLITCKNGGTCLSKQNGGFCQCPPEFTGNRCEKKIGVLASCTFDDGPCFLTNIKDQDTMDWLITKKRTPSLNTGPNKPLDGNYTFIEATGRTAGDNASLSSAATSHFFLRGPVCLRFFYNMNGRDMGTLNVFAGESNSEQNVWNISGNQNDIWTPVAVDIPPVNDLVIRIEAIRGKSYLSDIAIDTIELFDSPCIASLSSLPQRCTFEDGADCFLKDDNKFDDFDWIVKYGRTLSRDTGPSMAAEGKNYAYIEASGKRPGVRATLERLVPVPADGKMCLSFEYHMFGRTMGSLEVLFQNTTIFHEFGDRGNTWNKAELNLNGLNSTDVPLLQFTATRGSGFQSDVAIDNIQLYEGECAAPLPT